VKGRGGGRRAEERRWARESNTKLYINSIKIYNSTYGSVMDI
jgi:hypothetical protein